MPDRYALTLRTAFASNTGGPYTATWDRQVVPSTGTIRTAYAQAVSIASNTQTNRVDVFRQPDAPSAGSNTAVTILTTPIVLVDNRDSVAGTIAAANDRVTAGDVLEMRSDMNNAGSQPGFTNLSATVEIERD